MRCAIWRCAPISIWGDIAPKSEKIAEKWQYIFENLYFAIFTYQKHPKITKLPSCHPSEGEKRGEKRRQNPRACTRSARLPTAMLIFCCHKYHTREENGKEKRWFFGKKKEQKACFSVLFHRFFGGKNAEMLTHTKTNHNPLYYRGLRSNVWHLWQQKHKNSCTYARMRERERRRLQVFSHNSTPRFSYLDFGHLFCLLWLQIVLWKDTRRLQKMMACFQQNNVSFSIKQRVVFYKTTAHFS